MNLNKDQVTICLALWGAIGPLAGIVAGHFLTRSSQHKQWLRDNRKQEFKETVSAMSHCIVEHLAYTASLGSDLPQSKQAYVDVMKATYTTLCDRIYIHEDLSRANIPDRFLDLMNHYRESGENFDNPSEKASNLLEEIITLARKHS